MQVVFSLAMYTRFDLLKFEQRWDTDPSTLYQLLAGPRSQLERDDAYCFVQHMGAKSMFLIFFTPIYVFLVIILRVIWGSAVDPWLLFLANVLNAATHPGSALMFYLASGAVIDIAETVRNWHMAPT